MNPSPGSGGGSGVSFDDGCGPMKALPDADVFADCSLSLCQPVPDIHVGAALSTAADWPAVEPLKDQCKDGEVSGDPGKKQGDRKKAKLCEVCPASLPPEASLRFAKYIRGPMTL